MKALIYFSSFFVLAIFMLSPNVFNAKSSLQKPQVIKDTTRVYYDNGILSELIIREDGFISQEHFYDSNGTLSFQKFYYPYIDTLVEGGFTYIFYYENGNIEHIVSGNSIRRLGAEIYYYENGQVKEQGCFSCCLPNGVSDTLSLCKKKFYVQSLTEDRQIYFLWGYEKFYPNGQMLSKDSLSEETNEYFTIYWDSLGNRTRTVSFFAEKGFTY